MDSQHTIFQDIMLLTLFGTLLQYLIAHTASSPFYWIIYHLIALTPPNQRSSVCKQLYSRQSEQKLNAGTIWNSQDNHITTE